jgi:hypothetical protein
VRHEHLRLNFLNARRNGINLDFSIPTSATYHTPDDVFVGRIGGTNDNVSEPLGFDEQVMRGEWIPPSASTGTRMPQTKSIASFRGSQHHHASNRSVVFESLIEARFSVIAEARHDIVEIRDQWPVVHYVDCNGCMVSHTFDFWVRMKDGRSVAIAVKPTGRVNSSSILKTLQAIKEQGIGGFAEDVALVTEAYATEDAAYNARWKLHARRMRNEVEYRGALAAVSDLRGSVRLHDLVAEAEMPAHRRIAIWCLIDEGVLAPDELGRITDESFLHNIHSGIGAAVCH